MEDSGEEKSGTITGGSGVIYRANLCGGGINSENGTLIINGGNITGNKGGILADQNSLIVNGGVISGNIREINDDSDDVANYDIFGDEVMNGVNTVTVNGGEVGRVNVTGYCKFIMTGGYLEKFSEGYQENIVRLSGGYFGEEPESNYVEEGYSVVGVSPEDEGYREGYLFKVVESRYAYVASVSFGGPRNRI